ncbi:ParB/RepB/Spo0J family partition protein [Streptomyces xanthochromogenes]|uniref:ParB/RepB/Spo0J family partition protein n=1 Tax=Streptomyces xanthochromogenes TaxID=67384 RepID=UPI0034480C69
MKAKPFSDTSDGFFNVKELDGRRDVEAYALRHSGSGDVVTVEIGWLLPADSPRLTGMDEEHIALIADSEKDLPPITVHRQTLRVIDGMHRLKAANRRGDREIRVVFFDGSEEEAFVYSVKANNSHGLPLSADDRRAATSRLLTSRPEWSDRAIAEIVGMSAHTVASVRRSTAHAAQLNARVGRDGRLRPVSTTEGRRRAGAIMAERPHASLRQIAKETGLSLGTVTDVRRRVQRGEDPIPAGRSAEGGRAEAVTANVAGVPAVDVKFLWSRLSRDPSLRYTEGGRQLLKLLGTHTTLSEMSDTVPFHCARNVALLARECANAWNELARRLEAVKRSDSPGPAVAKLPLSSTPTSGPG